MHRLEMVWRSTVRIVMQTRRSDRQSMTTILQRLYWLPMKILFFYDICKVYEKSYIDMNMCSGFLLTESITQRFRGNDL